MTTAADDVLNLRGIGPILARRLADAGMGSMATLLAAGEEGLRRIEGLNPRAIPSILEQASALTGVESGDTPPPAAAEPQVLPPSAPEHELREMVATLRIAIQELATAARDRFPEEVDGTFGRKLTRNMVAGLDALYAIEELLERRPKRSRKALTKAMNRLDGLADATTSKQLKKGLKRARKTLQRVTS